MKLFTHTTIRATIAVSTLLVAASVASGCSNGRHDATPNVALTSPSIGPITVPGSGYEASLKEPLAPYDTSNKDLAQLWQASTLLSVSCMHKRGFSSYTGQDIHATSFNEADVASVNASGAWGYLGAETARTKGFKTEQVVVADPANSGRQGMSEEERAASTACFQESYKTVNTASTAGSDLVKGLAGQAKGYTSRDKRVQNARNAWTSCMAEGGYTTTDPAMFAAQNWGQNALIEPTQEEIRAAQLDEKCTVSSNLASAYFSVYWGYQSQLVEKNAQVLASRKNELRAQLTKAAEIIARGETT